MCARDIAEEGRENFSKTSKTEMILAPSNLNLIYADFSTSAAPRHKDRLPFPQNVVRVVRTRTPLHPYQCRARLELPPLRERFNLHNPHLSRKV